MIDKIKVICTFVMLVLGNGFLFGQVIINPIQSNIPVLSLDHLKNVQLVNPTNNPISGRLFLEIKSTSQVLLTMESGIIQIPEQGNLQKNDIPWNDLFAVEDQNFVYSLMLSSNFGAGSYVYCYKFVADESTLLGMRCLENYSTRMSPPELKFPNNQSTITTLVPQLRWLNPAPIFSNELTYAIKLVKIEEDQGLTQALTQNLPLLERSGLRTNYYQYSAMDIPLEKGGKYGWKVVAFWNDLYLAETSEWVFDVNTESSEVPVAEVESYRSLKQKPDGTSYGFTNRIFIRYINKNNADFLDYTIFEKGNPDKIVKRLPKLELKPGLNQLIIDVKPLKIPEEVEYVLEVKETQNRFSYLQFSIKKE